MARILVTGANGHVGANLCRLLIDKGHDVVGLVRNNSDLRGLEGLDIDYCLGDVRDAESVRQATRGAQYVFNVAAVYATSGVSVEDIMRPAIDGVRNVLEAAAAAGVQRVVHTSSTAAVGNCSAPGKILDESNWHDDPATTYHRAKIESEKIAWDIADRVDLDMVVVNPAGIVGQYDYRITPTMKIIRGMLEGGVSTTQGGADLVDVRDVASGHLKALELGRRGQRYILVSGEHLSMRQIGSIITELAGIKVLHTPLPRVMIPALIPLTRSLMRALGKKDELTVDEAREFIGRWTWYDPTKSRNELGFAGRPVRESIDHTIRWLLFSGALSGKLEKRLALRFERDPAWIS